MATKITLLAKEDAFSRQASVVASILFGEAVRIHTGKVGDPLPIEVAEEPTDHLLSFLSPWIVPKKVLDRAGQALNFHPGSVDYPGIGCYNFALYENAAEFGAVCHHMLSAVDTGTVVVEKLFPVLASDTVESLKYRTMVTMLAMFHDVASRIAADLPLPVAERQWARRPFTRREMEALKIIDGSMSAGEVQRRIRATAYPGYPGPHTIIGGERFYLSGLDRPPLA